MGADQSKVRGQGGQRNPTSQSRIQGIDGRSASNIRRSSKKRMSKSRSRSKIKSSNVKQSKVKVTQSRLIYQSKGLERVTEDPNNLAGFKAINIPAAAEHRDREVDYHIESSKVGKSNSSIKDKMTFQLDTEGGVARTAALPTFNYSRPTLSHDIWERNRTDADLIESKAGRDDRNTLASRVRMSSVQNPDALPQEEKKESFFSSMWRKSDKQKEEEVKEPEEEGEKKSIFSSLWGKKNEKVESEKQPSEVYA